jgi:predicted lipid-binding transport protein (Tim44 family)
MHNRSLFAAGLLALALVLSPTLVSARLGGGSSFGSRGGMTFSMPRATPTSPGGAAPIQRSMNPNYGSPSRTSPGFGGFGSPFGGFGRGLLGGLLGAGLFGMFFGHGFFGGFGGGSSILGFLLQIGLLIFLFRLAMRWFAGPQMGFAGGIFGGGRGAAPASGPFAAPSAGPSTGSGGRPISLSGEDFNAFEFILQESQLAFGAEDLDRLRRVSTPEMASYFAEQMAQNARRGVIDKAADVRLVKGDLSEAWAEATGDYATVAMRFSMLDWTVERDSGRLVDGDPQRPQDVSEVWTFRRDPGGDARGWRISAIQQAR